MFPQTWLLRFPSVQTVANAYTFPIFFKFSWVAGILLGWAPFPPEPFLRHFYVLFSSAGWCIFCAFFALPNQNYQNHTSACQKKMWKSIPQNTCFRKKRTKKTKGWPWLFSDRVFPKSKRCAPAQTVFLWLLQRKREPILRPGTAPWGFFQEGRLTEPTEVK